MEISRIEIKANGISHPAARIFREGSRGTALLLHGFGGNKEEMLGLGWRLAEFGFDSVSVDMRGHGENNSPMNSELVADANALAAAIRSDKPVIAVGHSLGGRIALLSEVDYRIGISPAIGNSFPREMQQMINFMRRYRVAEDSEDVFSVLDEMPNITKLDTIRDFIVFGSRDVPEIMARCREIAETDNVRTIDMAQHGDIFLYEKTYRAIEEILGQCAGMDSSDTFSSDQLFEIK